MGTGLLARVLRGLGRLARGMGRAGRVYRFRAMVARVARQARARVVGEPWQARVVKWDPRLWQVDTRDPRAKVWLWRAYYTCESDALDAARQAVAQQGMIEVETLQKCLFYNWNA